MVVTGEVHLPADDRVVTRPTTSERAAADIAALVGDGEPASLVIVLEAGDRVEPDLLHHVVSHAWDDPAADLLYWDDDLLDASGAPGQPRFRPSWSPDILLGANYLGRSFALRRRAVSLDGFDPALGDAVWWDLLLRAGLVDSRVVRIPRVLTHLVRRPAPSPEQGRAAVAAHLERRGWQAELTDGPAGVQVHWAVPDPPHVTVVIPTRHNRGMLSTCLPSLAATDYPSFDVRIVDNGGRTDDHEAWYRANDHGLDLEVVWWDEPFNYSR